MALSLGEAPDETGKAVSVSRMKQVPFNHKGHEPRSLSDSKMKSSINSDRIFYKTAAMARFVSVDS